jgi:DNA polymerase
MTLYIDIETYSSVDIKKNSVYKYAAAPDFLILMAAWAIDDGPVQIALDPGDINAIPGLWDDQVEKVAHNAAFERICFSAFLREVADWVGQDIEPHEYLRPEDWTDTMALASEWGYPKSLGQLAKALGAEEKDEAGTRLINLFCKPNRKGQRTLPEDKPEEWQQFIAYCGQDVETLRDVHHKLPDWPTETERQTYLVDQYINDRGIAVDVEMARSAVATAEDNRMVDEIEFMRLTKVQNPGSNPQVLGWLKDQGVPATNLQAATVTELLAGDDLTPKVRRVLELRQDLALVAAKKYSAALDRVNADGRLRGAFAFFGAHTGRWAGRGVQLQNLPSATLGGKDAPDHEIETAIAVGVLDLKLGLGADAHTLKALVRAMFTGPLTVVDYASIEARVLAWLAGEEWALGAFADGRDIYVETAERMGGMTRKEGKVAVLALGYNGGVNSLRAMGADGSDKQLQRLVTQWRNANPAIVDLWAEMDSAFKAGDASVGDYMYVEKDGNDRLIRLPSGRAVVYHDVRQKWQETQFGRRRVADFADPKGPGFRTATYGGRLCENVTQAVARDILADALVRLHGKGYPIALHVHDEVGIDGDYPVDEIVRVMTDKPAWAKGLPIAAEGYKCRRYRKG